MTLPNQVLEAFSHFLCELRGSGEIESIQVLESPELDCRFWHITFKRFVMNVFLTERLQLFDYYVYEVKWKSGHPLRQFMVLNKGPYCEKTYDQITKDIELLCKHAQ